MEPPASTFPTPENPNGTPLSNGKANDGRFKKGWKGGPGNGKLARYAIGWRQQLIKVVTVKRFGELLERCYQAAMQGDASARKEILDRCLPKAPETVAQITSIQVNVTYAEPDPRPVED